MEFRKVPGAEGLIANAVLSEVLPSVLLVLIIVVLSVVAVVMLRKLRPGRSGGQRKWRTPAGPGDVSDPARQIEHISKVEFQTVLLLNREELTVLAVLEPLIAERCDGYRLMAQTSLGEIIRPKPGSGSKQDCDLAFRSINSKRLDFAIFDRSGRLVLALEYQGSGHYRETSFMRDAVKREALRKAGVPMLEVPVRFNPEELAGQVRRALGQVNHAGATAA